MRTCPKPDGENYPYSDDTFKLITKLAPTIKKYSRKYNIPPIAVAGAIADEYNTRGKYLRAFVDWGQDVFISLLSDRAIRLDHKVGVNSKWLNATKHDLGIGNIKLETAMKIYNYYKIIFGKQINSWDDLVDYILTDEGTVHIASLVIRKAKFTMFPYFDSSYSDEIKEALYITYYKQGESFVTRYKAKPPHERKKGITPGEGCRGFYQRDKFKTALGIK